MGPLFHFFTTFFLVLGAAQLLSVPITEPVLVLALFGGLIPDFTHHTGEFIIAAAVAFVTVAGFALDNRFSFEGAVLFGGLAVGALLWIRSQAYTPPEYKTHKRHEFKKEWWSRARLAYSYGYLLVFTLAAFVFTGSVELGILAFLAYGMHIFFDWLTYG